jgi:hypothetical protein
VDAEHGPAEQLADDEQPGARRDSGGVIGSIGGLDPGRDMQQEGGVNAARYNPSHQVIPYTATGRAPVASIAAATVSFSRRRGLELDLPQRDSARPSEQ